MKFQNNAFAALLTMVQVRKIDYLRDDDTMIMQIFVLRP